MSTITLDPLCAPTLSAGVHAAAEEEACVWEAVNLCLTGVKTDERPPGVQLLLYGAIAAANDILPDDERQQLWPIALRALGSAERSTVEIAVTAVTTALAAVGSRNGAASFEAVRAADDSAHHYLSLRSDAPVVGDASSVLHHAALAAGHLPLLRALLPPPKGSDAP